MWTTDIPATTASGSKGYGGFLAGLENGAVQNCGGTAGNSVQRQIEPFGKPVAKNRDIDRNNMEQRPQFRASVIPSSLYPLAVVICCSMCGGCSSHVDNSSAESRVDPASTAPHDPPPAPPPAQKYVPQPTGVLTFTADIAPILFQKCAACHRPGEIGPFPLLTYAAVKKRVRQIVEVTQHRIMPPWSAEPGYCNFRNDGSLTIEELGKIAQWNDEGAPEGDPSDLPALPQFTNGWKFGVPDLVVEMSEPYTLRADVKDTNRNFVVHVPIRETKYVKGWDFNPGNAKIAHHAFLTLDPSGSAQRLDESDSEPGYDGTMMEGGRNPPGFNLGWLPGYSPPPLDESLSWRLDPGTDLVLELHLCGTGKEETLQSSIALYFASQPPTAHPGIAALLAPKIDIPPGEKAYVVRDHYVLPVAARVTGIGPHAHFRGKDVQVWADLPDGSQSWLLRIKDWDFNWQNAYTYATPFSFPQGTTLRMQLTYDNSAENPRNPTIPPKRVLFGRGSNDEMGEIVINLLLDSDQEADILNRDLERTVLAKRMGQLLALCQSDPQNAEAHFILGCRFQGLGDMPQAIEHFEAAIRIDPSHSRSYNNLGNVFRKSGRLQNAIQQYAAAIRINPEDAKAHNNLGTIYLAQGDLERASTEFKRALEITPDFAEAEFNLGAVAMKKKDFPTATTHFERAIELNPQYELARKALDLLRSKTRRETETRGEAGDVP